MAGIRGKIITDNGTRVNAGKIGKIQKCEFEVRMALKTTPGLLKQVNDWIFDGEPADELSTNPLFDVRKESCKGVCCEA